MRQAGQKEVFEWNEDSTGYGEDIINLCRQEAGKWRAEAYPNTTRVSRQLLTFWFANPERMETSQLFFPSRRFQ